MKNLIKNNLFGFVLGIVLCSFAFGVYAINSNTIVFESEHDDWEVNTVQEALDELYDSSNLSTKLVSLWTNPDTTATFNSQTINLDLSNYDYVLISSVYGGTDNGKYYETQRALIRVGSTGNIMSVYTSDFSWHAIREVTVSTTGVTFGDAWRTGYRLPTVSENSVAIPVEIYGLVTE